MTPTERPIPELLATFFNTYKGHAFTAKKVMELLKLPPHKQSSLYSSLNGGCATRPEWMEIATCATKTHRTKVFKSLSDQWRPSDFDPTKDPTYVKREARRKARVRREKAKMLDTQPCAPASAPRAAGLLSRLKQAELMANMALKHIGRLEKRMEHLERLLS